MVVLGMRWGGLVQLDFSLLSAYFQLAFSLLSAYVQLAPSSFPACFRLAFGLRSVSFQPAVSFLSATCYLCFDLAFRSSRFPFLCSPGLRAGGAKTSGKRVFWASWRYLGGILRILRYLGIILTDLVPSWAILGPLWAVSERPGEGSSESSWDRKWQNA